MVVCLRVLLIFLGAVITGIGEEVGVGASWVVRCGQGHGDVVLLSYDASSGWRLSM